MIYVLGISAFYHDSAAVLIKDGDIVAAAQEERFTRKKHDSSYPYNAVKFVLENQGISLSQVEKIVFYEKPFLKFNRLVETYLAFVPRGYKQFTKAMPSWIKSKLFLNEKKPISKNKILSLVWHYSSEADTHTVETHIYRLRKKVNDAFLDDKFILNNKDGYYL